MRGRRGFTLVEVLFAVAISAVVATELGVVFAGIFRLQKERMWNVEFSERLRAVREQVLFRAAPSGSDGFYGGLLSATNITWVAETGELRANFQVAGGKGQESAYEAEARELPARIRVVGVDDGLEAVRTQAFQVTNDLMFVSVSETITYDGVRSNRVERIAVPVFDKKGRRPFWDDFITVKPEGIAWKEQK